MRPPTEAALRGLALERRDFAAKLPKLYVVTINQLLSAFLGCVIIAAVKINCLTEVTIFRDDVCPILDHFGPPLRTKIGSSN